MQYGMAIEPAPREFDTVVQHSGVKVFVDPTVESVFPARVGIAVKGAKPDEVGRGDIICAEDGGVIDDIIIYRIGDGHFLVIVNASNTDVDFGWMRSHLGVCGWQVWK